MSAPLVRKELREHRWQALIVVLLLGVGLLALAINPQNAAGSYLEIVRRFTLLLLPLGSWRVAQRLITREYSAKTQLYLETLPVTRAQVLVTKWLMGALFVLGLLGAAIVLAALLARHHEVLETRRMTLLTVRAASFSLLIYSALAATALLGRYRVALGLFALFAVVLVTAQTNISLTQIGPALLVGDDLAYERIALPLQALMETWAFIAAFIALALTLGLVREGSVQAMLAERMSHREKVFLGCVFVGLIIGMYVVDEVKTPKPFHIASGESVTRDGIDLHVALGDPSQRAQAHALAEHEAQLLNEVRDYLKLAALPSISILPSAELDPDVFERAKLEKRDGLVVRADFEAPEFDRTAFDEWLIGEVLTWSSREDTLPEERQWVADGFAAWWVTRGSSSLQKSQQLRERYGLPSAPTWPLLHDWLTTRERLGPCISGAIAAGALESLRATSGEDHFQGFLRAALGWQSPKSVRALWKRRTTESLLREHAGLAPDALIQAWNGRLSATPNELAAQLATLDRPRAELVVTPLGSSAREARFRLLGPTSEPVTLLYTSLPPLDGPVDLETFHPELFANPDTDWHALPATFPAGSRLGWTVTERVPALGCRVWTGLRREVLW